MDRFTYRAKLTPASTFDATDIGFVVTFPDWEAGVTQGDDEPSSLAAAADALNVMVACCLKEGGPIPEPASQLGPCEHWVAIEPLLAGKAGLYLAMRQAGVSQAELARRLGIDPREVRRMLDPRIASTRLSRLNQALGAVGKRLVVDVQDAAA